MNTLDAYVSPLGKQLWAVCTRCDKLHYHGRNSLFPAPHCADPDAPVYDLRVVGPAPPAWAEDPSRVRPSRFSALAA